MLKRSILYLNHVQCWEKANNNQKLAYNDVLFEKLLGLNIPSKAINCKDISCNNTDHKAEIDSYGFEILEAVSNSGNLTIPTGTPCRSKNDSKVRKKTVGWNIFVEPFQDKANFWNSVWRSAGKGQRCLICF